MADLTVSADIDTFMGAANFAAARTFLGAASLGVNTFTGTQTIASGGLILPSTGVFAWSTRTAMQAPADGTLILTNNAGTDFTRLQFGGGTAAFPAIKRAFDSLSFVKADDSGPCNINAKDAVFGASSPANVTRYVYIGDMARDGTDVNALGGNGTILSGSGTGTGTPSYLEFQTPVLGVSGSAAQLYAVRLRVNANGIYSMGHVYAGPTGVIGWNNGCAMQSISDGVIRLTNGAGSDFTQLELGAGAAFPAIKRNGAGLSFRLADDSGYTSIYAADATFGAQGPLGTTRTVYIGDAARPGIDVNVAGGAGLIQSGSGTGTGTPSPLIFQTPDAGVSGSAAQTYTTRMVVNVNGITTAAPAASTAAAWKLGNVAAVAPTAPDRTIAVSVGGTTYYLAAKTTNN